jgi:transcription initiation factor TFIIB
LLTCEISILPLISCTGDDPSRVGGPEFENSLLDFGLSTVIGRESDGAVSILSKYQNAASMNQPNQRLLIDGFKRMAKLGASLALPQPIIDRGNELYKKVVESDAVKHKKSEACIATCLYIATKQQNSPRTIKEICAAADVPIKAVTKIFSKMKKLKLYKRTLPSSNNNNNADNNINNNGNTNGTAGMENKSNDTSNNASAQFIGRFCSSLKISHQISVLCEAVANRAFQLNISTSSAPATLAGACIYLVTQLPGLQNNTARSLVQIGAVTHMAPSTMKQCYAKLFARRFELLPPNTLSNEKINQLPNP